MSAIDLVPLERILHEHLLRLRVDSNQESWRTVESTSKQIADNLRDRYAAVDNHTALGKTELPQTLTSLLGLILPVSNIPGDEMVNPVIELLRMGANLCMDHDDNRAALLDVGFPQKVASLVEGYVETIPSPFNGKPLALSIPHLKLVRTAIGVLLNASISFDPVKTRLISLEAASTLIKLSAAVAPPTAWVTHQDEKDFSEEWTLRCGISSWAWRTVSALKEVPDDSLTVISQDVLPWIAPALLRFGPEHFPPSDSITFSHSDLLDTLVQSDYDFLEESCTLIEGLSLDLEDFRLELPRATCTIEQGGQVSCLSAVLQFIEHGTYPPIWNNEVFDEVERKAKEKGFNICKAALIKAVVEVFGEEKNEEVLWESVQDDIPGGALVAKMVNWIKNYVESLDSSSEPTTDTNGRDDMAICATLSLGNLTTKALIATALLSPPYGLGPILGSQHYLSPSSDIKLKHGVLGLLKRLSQFSKLSPVIPEVFSKVEILSRISNSGIWDEKSDAMANIIQLNAIGVAKHLCNLNLDLCFELVLPSTPNQPTPFSKIVALIKRSDSVPIKSEGSRVLVNIVKTLFTVDRALDASDEEKRKKRDRCISTLVTPECTRIFATLIGRSNRYPILVNEGIVAISLLSTHSVGSRLVCEALLTPVNNANSEDGIATASSSVAGPLVPSSTSESEGLPVPRHALDMLIYALKNVDNPVNFAVEIRLNVCAFFLQLQKTGPAEILQTIGELVVPVARQVAEESLDEPGEEKIHKATTLLVKSWGTPPTQAA